MSAPQDEGAGRPYGGPDGAPGAEHQGDGAHGAHGEHPHPDHPLRPRIARARRHAGGRPSDEGDIRIAAIDIGSNSIRQILADVSEDGKIHVVDEMKAMPRLGAGVDDTGALSEESMRAAITALSRMATLDRQMSADRIEEIGRAHV